MRDAQALFSLTPTPGNALFNTTDAIRQYGRVTKRLVEVNAEYVWDLAAAVRKHVTGLAGVWKDEVVTTAKLANSTAEKLEDAELEKAEEVQRTERAGAPARKESCP